MRTSDPVVSLVHTLISSPLLADEKLANTEAKTHSCWETCRVLELRTPGSQP